MSRRQKGVALLLVLWALAMLTVLMTGLLAMVRQESQLGRWQREHTRALMAANAGVSVAIRALKDPVQRKQWVADGRSQNLQFDDAVMQVSVRSERGKLDLNAAQASALGRLVITLGASREQAASLASSLNASRAVGAAPLQVLEELRLLPGMTERLYTQLLPNVTLWSGLDSPQPELATEPLRQALGLPQMSAQNVDVGPIVSIRSAARLADGVSAVIQTTVLLSTNDGVRPYRVLRYSE